MYKKRDVGAKKMIGENGGWELRSSNWAGRKRKVGMKEERNEWQRQDEAETR